MAEYIKREDAINAVLGYERYTGIAEMPVEFAEVAVMLIPAADVRENMRGQWVECPISDGLNQCSNCEYMVWADREPYSYCPNCGADMRGD